MRTGLTAGRLAEAASMTMLEVKSTAKMTPVRRRAKKELTDALLRPVKAVGSGRRSALLYAATTGS
jgi:hypothetical protein